MLNLNQKYGDSSQQSSTSSIQLNGASIKFKSTFYECETASCPLGFKAIELDREAYRCEK